MVFDVFSVSLVINYMNKIILLYFHVLSSRIKKSYLIKMYFFLNIKLAVVSAKDMAYPKC